MTYEAKAFEAGKEVVVRHGPSDSSTASLNIVYTGCRASYLSRVIRTWVCQLRRSAFETLSLPSRDLSYKHGDRMNQTHNSRHRLLDIPYAADAFHSLYL